MKEPLWLEHLSLSLSEEAPWRGPWGGGGGAPSPGTLEDMFRLRIRYLSPYEMLLLHPQSNPVFTVYAVCLQKEVHKAEVLLFESSNKNPEGNTARRFRLQHCRKK
jgi:hypothetical protein